MSREEQDPKYWKDITVGSSVHLDDAQTVEECGVDGLDAEVNYIDRINIHGLFEYVILALDPLGQNIVLIKIVDDVFDLRVYKQITDIYGNREDVLDKDMQFLFNEPEDEQFELNDLKYADHLTYEDIIWEFKDTEYDGESTRDPGDSGVQYPLLATLREYGRDYNDKTGGDSEMILIEVGDAEDERGGDIRMYTGYNIGTEDIEVTKI